MILEPKILKAFSLKIIARTIIKPEKQIIRTSDCLSFRSLRLIKLMVSQIVDQKCYFCRSLIRRKLILNENP